MRVYSRFLVLLLALISFDQLFKAVFSKNDICNKNLAWSIPIFPGVFYFLWLIIFFLLLYFFLKSKDNFERMALTFVFAGAISNMADRVTSGCVLDFIKLKFFPVFNFADIYITIGILLLLIIQILNPKHQILNKLK